MNEFSFFEPVNIGTKLSDINTNQNLEVFNFNSIPIPNINLFPDVIIHEIVFRANLSKKLTLHKYSAYLERTITRVSQNTTNQKIIIYPPFNSNLTSIVICTIKKITTFYPIILIHSKSFENNTFDLFLIDLNGIEISLK